MDCRLLPIWPAAAHSEWRRLRQCIEESDGCLSQVPLEKSIALPESWRSIRERDIYWKCAWPWRFDGADRRCLSGVGLMYTCKWPQAGRAAHFAQHADAIHFVAAIATYRF